MDTFVHSMQGYCKEHMSYIFLHEKSLLIEYVKTKTKVGGNLPKATQLMVESIVSHNSCSSKNRTHSFIPSFCAMENTGCRPIDVLDGQPLQPVIFSPSYLMGVEVS